VNLSGRSLQQPTLADFVEHCLAETGLLPTQLMLEITESVMVRYCDAASEMLNRLRTLGVVIAIDDFGTGYSSMSSLANLPIDILKIDQTFVARLSQHTETHAILQAMIDLAKAMKLEVVSEGIETQQQCDSLQLLGSHYGQGYLFSRPLSPDDLEALLAEQHPKIRLVA
jgi:diguanylate cyclase